MSRFKSEEAKQHWNTYYKGYAKLNYKTTSIKLSKKTDADIIAYLEEEQRNGHSVKDVVARLVRKELKG